jgi:predicted methyltransferase
MSNFIPLTCRLSLLACITALTAAARAETNGVFDRATQHADIAAEYAMSTERSSRMNASSSDCNTRATITNALAHPERPPADRALDADRHPAELLSFSEIAPGDRVADLMPGNGYYTRILSKVVGPSGHVYAILPESLASKVPHEKFRPIQSLAQDPEYSSNTTLETRPFEKLNVGAPLDVVWTSQNYHDVYGGVSVFSVMDRSGSDEAAILDSAVFDALKPGGLYIVIDHAARPGAGGGDAKTLHRIDPATVISQASAAGFVLGLAELCAQQLFGPPRRARV